MTSQQCRFSELKPKGVESNLFQYHLGKLIKDGYVEKVRGGYSLSTKGLYMADRHSFSLKTTRPQPKIITVTRLYNHAGEVLVLPKYNQPFIGSYHLPAGKVHEGESAHEAAQREVREKAGIDSGPVELRAVVHATIRRNSEVISEYYATVFDAYSEATTRDEVLWVGPTAPTVRLAPSVAHILSLPLHSDIALHEWDIETGDDVIVAPDHDLLVV